MADQAWDTGESGDELPKWKAEHAKKKRRKTETAPAADAPHQTSTISDAAPAADAPRQPSTLSIGEIKTLLTAAGVDFSHCIEKGELLALLPAAPAEPTGPPAQSVKPHGAATGKHWAHMRDYERDEQMKCMSLGISLAERYLPERDDLRGFVATEKFDGVRATWEVSLPNSPCFRTKSGKTYEPPDWFAAALPADMRLDGELWLGYGQFEDTIGALQTRRYEQLTYVVFDAPAAGGGYVQRLEAARARVEGIGGGSAAGFVMVVSATECESDAAVEAQLSEVMGRGGEGLVLRRAASRFLAGRSRDLLKVKPVYDAEAKVLGHNRFTTGKDSLRCLALGGSNVEFDLTWNRAAPPPVPGTIITYTYQKGLQGGQPRFPKFARVRPAE